MESELKNILSKVTENLANCQSLKDLESIEIQFLGRKSELTELLKKIKDLPADEKPIIGQQIQQTKITVEELISTKKSSLELKEIETKLENTNFDPSFPGIKPKNQGTIHLLTKLQEEVETIFSTMGFSVLDGPEVDSEFYNFDALNIPSHHPARDMQDTFFLNNSADPEHGKLVLRTHTSNTQVRSLLKLGAPLKAIFPGRVFRYESTDATHDSTFFQVEGMLIDRHINLSNLKGIMLEFLGRLFNKEIEIRFRPGYFPFVEPGIELDILWTQPNGKQRWLEFMGAGMIHPNVLKNGNLDPEEFQGWAFGFGLTRLAMLKYNIPDLRVFHENDLRFLNQF